MDSLTGIGTARLFCFALSLLMVPLSLWFWLKGVYFKSKAMLHLALGIFFVVSGGLIIAQIMMFRVIGNIEGRISDYALTLIVLAQSAISLVIGAYREKLRDSLGLRSDRQG